MRPALRQARRLLQYDVYASQASIPAFLCPALLRAAVTPGDPNAQKSPPSFPTFRHASQQASDIYHSQSNNNHSSPGPSRRALPISCPGCGAPTQAIDKSEAGYYNIDRNAVKAYLNHDPTKKQGQEKEDDVYTRALQANPALLEEIGLDKDLLSPFPEAAESVPDTPVCDRCHNLIHHHTGTPIHHPSIASIHETIAESPHKRNHIYHVLDAADFPLSLIPNLQTSLRLPTLRTQNRRARHKGWVSGDRIAEVSFIITRADLLAPLKEQVDRLMPYMQQVLRRALGRVNKNARLGNVRLVSAKRGWWTKQVKEDIWDRGGAGWMVGKANVGKSNLFEAVFPKGRGSNFHDVRKIRSAAEREQMLGAAKSLDELVKIQQQLAEEDAEIERAKNQPSHLSEEAEIEQHPQEYDPDSLLPPAQPYSPYPVLPLISSLPGTTASPIRIPFGRNRGELVDLPGLARTTPDLSTFVHPLHRPSLIMNHRITAYRHVLKPGQSLILGGGLIRITPTTSNLIFLLHPFVPIDPHVTSTDKATAMQNHPHSSGVPSILSLSLAPGTFKSAGRFKLKWDVTKKLAGPLTDPTAGKMKPENLPFRIWSTDILVEGVGWVEVVAQVRRHRGWKPVGHVKKDPHHARYEREDRLRAKAEKVRARIEKREAGSEGDAFDRAGLGELEDREESRDEDEDEDEYPEVEVFSPLGKFIGARMPMSASVLGGPKTTGKVGRKTRPRRSMVSVKAQRKPNV
ncbi:uncharacterized protein BDR25DRAFT_303683 [Lindgomyces ingoldianus]|uniref:Uncharacterized protein n=1 Tax=Lindgomyces ingoldianus TaxID=673940 RepID=A0ACB6QX27_9PLEO|nr:uncharacterized protein BDR25DRAFT_303683 [Lindgomyces ingoldianus]KAF2470630.1 hypothetical protein BDR25DRAFT_303683 [Lindgomyces ingoldianus]